MLVVVVLIDGFAAVPIRFVAPANIFSKISRAAGIGRANWKFVKTAWRKRNRFRWRRVFGFALQKDEHACKLNQTSEVSKATSPGELCLEARREGGLTD